MLPFLVVDQVEKLYKAGYEGSVKAIHAAQCSKDKCYVRCAFSFSVFGVIRATVVHGAPQTFCLLLPFIP